MELIKSFFTVSEGITMHHAHTSQWAEAFPPQLTVPRGMQVPIYGIELAKANRRALKMGISIKSSCLAYAQLTSVIDRQDGRTFL